MTVIGEKDFFSKSTKVLDLTTSWIATVSLKGSFWVRVLIKRERNPLNSPTEPTGGDTDERTGETHNRKKWKIA